MLHSVKDLVQQKSNTLLLTHSPATEGQPTKNELRKKNLERLRHFLPSDYSFESFIDMCEVFQPQWYRISPREGKIVIQYAQTKDKGFFAKGKTFPKAFQRLMQSIHRSTTETQANG